MRLLAIPPERVDEIWWLARAQLALATSWTLKATIDTVYADLIESKAQLWVAFLPAAKRILCSCVTDLQKWESGHMACRVLLIGGGRLELWRHLVHGLEAYAAAEGAQTLEIIGRKGWERIFRDDGYIHSETTIAKELD